ncbi:hypothetical protein E3J61_02670 [Candidatus Dependentiae bacterium]|nr:MAG: hypothetical protein E3J61_02670 [Candidatus Dependentiae bacterium]
MNNYLLLILLFAGHSSSYAMEADADLERASVEVGLRQRGKKSLAKAESSYQTSQNSLNPSKSALIVPGAAYIVCKDADSKQIGSLVLEDADRIKLLFRISQSFPPKIPGYSPPEDLPIHLHDKKLFEGCMPDKAGDHFSIYLYNGKLFEGLTPYIPEAIFYSSDGGVIEKVVDTSLEVLLGLLDPLALKPKVFRCKRVPCKYPGGHIGCIITFFDKSRNSIGAYRNPGEYLLFALDYFFDRKFDFSKLEKYLPKVRCGSKGAAIGIDNPKGISFKNSVEVCIGE